MESTEEKPKKKVGAPKGRIMTEAQREGLKKGFEALKAKREALKAEKEAKKLPVAEKKEELPVNNQVITEAPAVKPLDTPPALVIAKKTRNRIPAVKINDFEAFKNDIYSKLSLPVVAPVSVAPVAPVAPVAAPHVLSGSALLNKIFFNK
jgi:hypothetical protein